MTRRALVIDDYATGRRGLARRLRDGGYLVTEAATLKEALARIAIDRPSLIVTDLNLIDSRGVDTARAVMGEAGAAAVIVVTAATDDPILMAELERMNVPVFRPGDEPIGMPASTSLTEAQRREVEAIVQRESEAVMQRMVEPVAQEVVAKMAKLMRLPRDDDQEPDYGQVGTVLRAWRWIMQAWNHAGLALIALAVSGLSYLLVQGFRAGSGAGR